MSGLVGASAETGGDVAPESGVCSRLITVDDAGVASETGLDAATDEAGMALSICVGLGAPRSRFRCWLQLGCSDQGGR